MSVFRFIQIGSSALVFVIVCAAQETASPAAQELVKKPVAAPADFVPVCSTPGFPSPPPETKPVIDSQCGLPGSGGDEANQNIAKNNFCASGAPTDMTVDDFVALQKQVDDNPSIPFGDTSQSGRAKGPAQDRAPLEALGEGTLVRMQGHVLFGKQEGSESVNCGTAVQNHPPFHDIHIELVSASDVTEECSGVVAEMVPHHRPDSWIADNVQEVAKAKLPVRVTGQLFFDSSHVPCKDGVPVGDNPKRASLWEIHPIYAFEVCSAGDCSSGTGWVPLNEWLTANTAHKGKK